MNKRNPIREYLRRLFRQTWLLVTGGIGFLVTLVAELFFPNLYVFAVYLIIFVMAVIIGGYFAFVDLLLDYEKLEDKLKDIESKKPDIKVAFQKGNGRISKEIELHLSPLPPKPDYDSLVEQKRKNLFANRPENRGMLGLAASALSHVNTHYDQDVIKYIEEYREYLVKAYECSLDRAFAILPFIENKGQYPANNVTIEFIMPTEFEEPSEHHCFDRATTDRKQIEYYIFSPREPKPYIDLSSLAYMAPLNGFDSMISHFEGHSNINGPKYEEKDGKVHIKYTIDKLVQHNPEDDFDPFWVWLGNIEQDTFWEISVRITSADLRIPEEDVLFISIKNS
ncbi:MAG: hypothetical protein Q7U34_05720 [Anaerolineales bacterium]|nr:hypothetical protein [Anaerolineales bacterium]